MDTSPEIHAARLKILREKSVEWKIQKTLELCDMSRQMFPEQTKLALKKEMARQRSLGPQSSEASPREGSG